MSSSSSSPSRVNLYFAACGANLATFSIGNGYTWTSPSLPKLEAADSWLHLQGDEASWIGSLHSLGATVSPTLAGYLTPRLGRKWTCNIAIMIEIVSWIILLLANSVIEIYISRFILGIAGGLVCTTIPMYVGEIAEDSVRGALGTLLALFICIGYLLTYCIGPYVSYDILIYCSLIPPIIFIIVFTFLPESPYFLLQKDKKSEALASLTWLRKGRTPDDVEKELNMMQQSVEEDMKNAGNLSDLFSTRSNRYALMLTCGAAAFQMLSGVNVVLFYSESIFNMVGTSFSSSISTIIVGVILVLSAAAAAPIAKLFASKHIFIFSAAGMAVFHGFLGFYFFLKQYGHDISALWWLPIVSLVGYIAVYGVGFGPLPWALMAEVFPANVKPVASAITISVCWGMSFISTRYFNYVSETLGTYVSFWLFGVFCIFAFFYSVFLVPNTKGKSFREIQDILNKHMDVLFFAIGCFVGWTSPTIPQLKEPDSWLRIDDFESSWVASLQSLGGAVGPLLVGILLDVIGRKKTTLIIFLFCITSWIVLLIAKSVYYMYVARFISGCAIGIAFAAIPLYIAEITEESVRGAANALIQFSVTVGILLMYCVGPYVSYTHLIVVAVVSSSLFIMLYPWLPESPYYLVAKKKRNEAYITLRWLRNETKENIENEIDIIQESTAQMMSQNTSINDLVATTASRKALLLAGGLVSLQQLTGINTVLFYTQSIFIMSGASISSSVSTITIGFVMLVAGFLSSPYVKYFGYRTPLLLSAIGMTVTHFSMAVYFFLYNNHYNVSSLYWLPLLSLGGFIFTQTLGFANIPWVLTGELFPANVKAAGSAFVTILCSVILFGIANLFPNITATLGTDFAFFVFTFFSIISFFFVLFLVPETSTMSLTEIQELMNRKSFLVI